MLERENTGQQRGKGLKRLTMESIQRKKKQGFKLQKYPSIIARFLKQQKRNHFFWFGKNDRYHFGILIAPISCIFQ